MGLRFGGACVVRGDGGTSSSLTKIPDERLTILGFTTKVPLAVSWVDTSCLQVSPPETATESVRPLANLNDRTEINTHEFETLAILRDTMLPKMLAGELCAGDAAGLVEEATA